MELSNRNLVEKKLTAFFEKHRLAYYKKGELLFRPGDDFANIYFIKSGYVRLFINDEDGKEITINAFKPVFYLSLNYALGEGENRYFFEALTDVEMWKAPKQEVIEFIKEDKEILGFLTERLLKITEELMRHVEVAISGDAYSKVAALIISLAKSSGKKTGNKIELEFTTTHRLIASLTGLSRETASIQIKKLEREGYINQNRSLLLVNDCEKMENDFAKE
jgi:CRP/FNR family transcriptional regulator